MGADPSATAAVPAAAPYTDLTPAGVLDALDGVGLFGDGRLIQLNSYENRVFQVFLEDGRVVVAKFYRPARWTDAQILEEHAFAAELGRGEIPVAVPIELRVDAVRRTPHRSASAGPTLAALHDRPASPTGSASASVSPVAPRSSRIPRCALARPLHRPHACGRRASRFAAPADLDVASYGEASRDWLLAREPSRRRLDPLARARRHRRSPPAATRSRRAVRSSACTATATSATCSGPMHGPHFVDLDDAVTGPAMQDLWMLLSGDRAAMTPPAARRARRLRSFMEFDWRELRLLEPLRTLRILHHSAWIARRWNDPSFPIAFPWFASPSYWADQCMRLREQLDAMAERLGSPAESSAGRGRARPNPARRFGPTTQAASSKRR